MPDVVRLRFRIGTWMDESDGRELSALGDLEMLPSVPSRDEFIDGTLETVRESRLEPWKHEFTESSYYANASGESWGLLIDVAPMLGTLTDPATARMIAGAFLGALLGRLFRKPDLPDAMMKRLDAEAASERVVDYMVKRDDLAPSEIAELSVAQMEDDSFEIVVRRETDGHHFLFRLEEHGFMTGRIDLTELEAFAKRHEAASQEEATDAR